MGIYDLKLNETTEIKTGCVTYNVTRVPGGWIYNHIRLDAGQMNSIFVPFDNEYMEGGRSFIETTSNCDIPVVSVSVCCKCKSDDIDIKFMPQRTNIAWSSHNTIKNIKNFTRNDSYYYNDIIDKECLIHTCKNCGFKEAVATER